MAKPRVILQEKYKKGVVVDKNEIKRMVDENIEKIVVEIRETLKYSDGTEGIVIEIRF
jgi:hypothetical protein